MTNDIWTKRTCRRPRKLIVSGWVGNLEIAKNGSGPPHAFFPGFWGFCHREPLKSTKNRTFPRFPDFSPSELRAPGIRFGGRPVVVHMGTSRCMRSVQSETEKYFGPLPVGVGSGGPFWPKRGCFGCRSRARFLRTPSLPKCRGAPFSWWAVHPEIFRLMSSVSFGRGAVTRPKSLGHPFWIDQNLSKSQELDRICPCSHIVLAPTEILPGPACAGLFVRCSRTARACQPAQGPAELDFRPGSEEISPHSCLSADPTRPSICFAPARRFRPGLPDSPGVE